MCNEQDCTGAKKVVGSSLQQGLIGSAARIGSSLVKESGEEVAPFSRLSYQLGEQLDVLENTVVRFQDALAPVTTRRAETAEKTSGAFPEVGVQSLDLLQATINRVKLVNEHLEALRNRLVI